MILNGELKRRLGEVFDEFYFVKKSGRGIARRVIPWLLFIFRSPILGIIFI
jgi:hypothetical protein